ncbi:hypothetical protein [Mesorhizobium sp. B2-7-2]|uniref:hypothetical protein n=1 Tax=Mesorhizobium sp. B2-7-2 TaxID=2589908 RepID=UPI0015E3A795|nr:hypothetical protein [Mesorhizobium sp. B2-7-2]
MAVRAVLQNEVQEMLRRHFCRIGDAPALAEQIFRSSISIGRPARLRGDAKGSSCWKVKLDRRLEPQIPQDGS